MPAGCADEPRDDCEGPWAKVSLLVNEKKAGKEKIIALGGVEDLVVVDTPDALLVCRKDQAQRVKEVLERLADPDWRNYT